jgi:hypothetical protein
MNEKESEQLKSLKTAAKNLEIETLHNMQSKFTNWIKASLGLFFVLLGMITFLGYNQTLDYKKNLEVAENELKVAKDGFAGQSSKFAETLKDYRNQVDADMEKLNRRIASLNATVIKMGDLSEKISQSQAALDKVGLQTGSAMKILEDVKKAQNSFYNISIAYQISSDPDDVLAKLIRKVKENGFTSLPENVYQTSVDKSEVIYFSADKPRQIKELVDILNSNFTSKGSTKTGSRFVDNRNPQEILIKLRLD